MIKNRNNKIILVNDYLLKLFNKKIKNYYSHLVKGIKHSITSNEIGILKFIKSVKCDSKVFTDN